MASEKVSTVFGTIGTVCWCIQTIPQIWYNWRRKDCTGFPPFMMAIWIASGVPFAAYFIDKRSNTALMVQPPLFMAFCSVALCQTLYYPPIRWRLRKAIIVMVLFLILCAGTMVALILPIRPLEDKGTTYPGLIIGIVASVLLGVGLLPPYFELWKHQGRAIGFNLLFLTIDSSGAVFSIISVAFQEGKLDILGLVLYCVVLVLELGIFVSHFTWCIRVKYFGLSPVECKEPEPEQELVQDCEDEKSIETV